MQSGIFDELLIQGLHDHTDGVIARNVAGGAEGVLRDVQCHHDGADGAVGVACFCTEDHVQEGQSSHDRAAGSAGAGHHGNAQSHNKGHNGGNADGQLVHQAHCGSAGGDGDHRTGHMDVGAQRHNKVTDLVAHAVSGCTLQVDRNGGSRGLCAQSGGVAGDLVADQGEGVLFGNCTGNGELNRNAHQMHDDDHQEHLPQNAQNGKGFAGLGHVDESAANIQGQQGNDHRVQHLINDAGEIVHAIIQRVADGFAAQGGKAQANHKGEHNSRKGIQNGRDRDRQIACQRVVGGGSDLFQSTLAHEVREQVGRNQIRHRTGDQGGAVSQSHRDQQQLACAAFQIGNAHAYIGHDHQGNHELQERAEDSRGRYDNAAEPHGEELADHNTQNDCDQQLGQQAKLNFFLFHFFTYPPKINQPIS